MCCFTINAISASRLPVIRMRMRVIKSRIFCCSSNKIALFFSMISRMPAIFKNTLSIVPFGLFDFLKSPSGTMRSLSNLGMFCSIFFFNLSTVSSAFLTALLLSLNDLVASFKRFEIVLVSNLAASRRFFASVSSLFNSVKSSLAFFAVFKAFLISLISTASALTKAALSTLACSSCSWVAVASPKAALEETMALSHSFNSSLAV